MMKKFLTILLILAAFHLIFPLYLQESPENLYIYKLVSNGKVPELVYPVFMDGYEKSSFELIPNYYFSNFETSPIGSWFNVVYDGATPVNIFNDLPEFGNLTLHFSNDSAAFHMEIFLRSSYNTFLKWPSSTMIFIPESPYVSFDSSFPYDSYLAFKPLDFLELYIGRTKISWGFWDYPVSISPYPPFYDNFTFRLDFGGMKYSYTVVGINPILTPEEYQDQSVTSVTNGDQIMPYNEKVKTLVAKRLDFIVSDNFRWSIGELGMIGGKVPDLYTLNPVLILHNLYDAAYLNVIGTLQISWTPFKGWNFYFDLALDDYAVPLTEPEDVKPTAYALSTGIVKTLRIYNTPVLISVNYSEATEWVYNIFLPYLKFDVRYLVLSNFPVGARVIYSYPIGFKYGPDSQLYSVRMVFMGENFNFDSELFYLEKGPRSVLSDYKGDYPSVTETFYGFVLKTEFSFGLGASLYLLNHLYHIGIYYRLFYQW